MQSRSARWLPLLALTAFGLVLLTPLFRWQAFCADDLLPHIHKAYALERLIIDGYWLPRWSPDLARGYGYPLFNFYAPLSSYPLVALHWIGLPYSAAIQVLMGLALLAAGVAMYAFVRDLFGEWPGFAAGVAYMAAPYLGYDIFYRGALAEVFGWIWLPLILWGIYHATRDASWQWVAIAALCYAALLPSHNVLALISTPLFAGWCVAVAIGVGDWKRLRFGGLALALGLTVAAYFWLPALLERNLVRIDRLLDPPLLQYNTNFISLNELLPLSWNFDPLLANPSPPRALGLLFALLTLPAIITLASRYKSAQTFNKHPELVEGCASSRFYTIAIIYLYLGLSLLAYALMTLDLSQPIWNAVPLLSFVQFPWRMLAPASACAAILVGAGVSTWGANKCPPKGPMGEQVGVLNLLNHPAVVEGRDLKIASEITSVGKERRTILFALTPSVLLVFFHLSWFTPLDCGPLLADSPETLRAETFQEGAYGYSEYLPATVQTFPADDSVYNTLIADEYPDRLLAEGIINASANDPLNATYTLDATSNQQAIYRQFLYPGWQVELDGVPLTLQSNPEGLITFPIPSGQHRLHIYFGETPLRAIADFLSLLGLVALLALWVLGFKRVAQSPPIQTSHLGISSKPFIVAALLGLSLAILRVGYLETFSSPVHHTAFTGEAVIGATPLRASFAGGVELYGYTLPDNIPSGQSFDVTLYAGIRQPVERRYVPSISIEDDQGLLWNDPQIDFPRWLRPPYTADAWAVGQYAQWARRITLLPGTPPGQYYVRATVYDVDTLVPDSVVDSGGYQVLPVINLGMLTVTRPVHPSSPESLKMQTTINKGLGDSITLLGSTLDRVEANAGESMWLTLFWRADQATTSDRFATFSLTDSNGQIVYQTSFRPVGDGFRTLKWQIGDVLRGQHQIHLRASLAAGDYQLLVGLRGQPGVYAGTIHINSPDRRFTQPEVQQSANAQLGTFTELIGYSINGTPRPGEPITLTLLWRGLSTPEASYSAFIHLSDNDGRVWAQSDGIPANWTRPTTGWIPDEYILDERTLTLPADLPAGNYSIFVGMADVLTGERAPVSGVGATEDNRILVGTLKVEN